MSFKNLNLGKPLSKEDQKKIKGGYPLCNAGQWAYCACATGNVCVQVPAQFESTGATCQEYCHKPPVAGYPDCYDGGCPAGGNPDA